MTDQLKDLALLSPEEKRALLARMLQKKAAGPVSHPLSAGQKALWFLQSMAPESAAYNLTFAARIRSQVDPTLLRQAFQGLVDRHPVLRTTFTVQGGDPVQLLHPQGEVAFQCEDASGLTDADLDEQIAEIAHRPFDLAKGPLLRVYLFTRNVTEHVLLLSIHHIIADYWSLVTIIEDLGVLYAAARAGKPPVLEPLPATYADFVRWQEGMLAGPEGAKLWEYWKEQLSGEIPALELPSRGSRPSVQTYEGAVRSFRLSRELTEQLKELSRNEGVTLYVTLLAAFQVLLARYSGQQDVVVGSSTAGRSRPEFTRMMGFFVNQVVMRSDLSEELPFRQFLQQVRQTVLGAIEHQDLPFSLLVERLGITRDASRSPLFQVEFTLDRSHRIDREGTSLFMQGHEGGRMDLGDLVLESFPLKHRMAPFDLTLLMEEVGGSLYGVLNYNTDLFDEAMAERLVSSLETLLAGAAANPDTTWSALPLLTAQERDRLLTRWNRPVVERTAEKLLFQRMEEHAERIPDKVALVFGRDRLTYRQLNERANQLAHHLRALGVGPEVLVGLCVERSLEMVVGILGIMKAGGAYLPLDPAYPLDRLAFMLQDSGAGVLLTQDHLVSGLPANDMQIVRLDTDRDVIARQRTDNPCSGVGSENLVYVIYTSGSTGKPKGVMIEHAGLANVVEGQMDAYCLGADERVLQFASLSFDASVYEIAMAFGVGGTLYLIPRETAQSGTDLVQLMEQESITNLTISPSALAALPDAHLPALRTLSVAGEACPIGTVDRWAPGRRMYNAYGPTETSICATIGEIFPGEKPPIGRPFFRKEIYLLDRHLQPVPEGVTGEVYIGGAGTARGYLNRPELTDERFVPSPFGGPAGSRLYKAGDLARCLPDGRIDFVGRSDDQVKVRGFRIELGEIEAVLSQHEALRDVAVVVRHEGGDPRLAAYLVPVDPAPSAAELRAWMRSRLPDYMCPSYFVTLDALPTTPNGKVNRKALPAPEGLRPELGAEYVAPRSETERVIAEVFEQVLRVDKVGTHDNFFDLGGHSLLVHKVQSELRERIGREIPIVEMFRHPTVTALGRYLDRAGDEQRTLRSDRDRGAARRELARRRQLQGQGTEREEK